ncbi:MAG: hypothetical protein WKF37_03510 [Bryobacteraceae bacterium]
MDTRIKINQPKEFVTRLVLGYFDPLHASHIRRLQELCSNGERISIGIMDPPDPILPLRARAELLAGLAIVDRVYEAPDLHQLAPAQVIDERSADLERAGELAAHVVNRNRQ